MSGTRPGKPELVVRNARMLDGRLVDLVAEDGRWTQIAESADVDGAKEIGRKAAEAAQGKGIAAVVFDRGGFAFHGRVKAIADAAREAGLKF